MRISDWSSDVCSSDLFLLVGGKLLEAGEREAEATLRPAETEGAALARDHLRADEGLERAGAGRGPGLGIDMPLDRKSVGYGMSVSGSVDLGGRGIITNKNQ